MTSVDLAGLSHATGMPVYWAGPATDGKRFELTRRAGDRVTVRYRGSSLMVGTYRVAHAIKAIRRTAKAPTAKLHRLQRHGLAVSDSDRPTNVYFAYPGKPVEVEVYDPTPGRALRLVLDGRVVPVR